MGHKIIRSLAIFFAASSPSAAFALDGEFYTYGGFIAVISALQKVALIFGSGDYTGLFFVAAVLGIFIGGIMLYTKALTGQRQTHMSWAVTVGIGVGVYLALIVPKGTLHVYDTVKNKYQAVGGIPDGIVLVAGTLNKIERGLVDIVSNAADPIGVQNQGQGVGFDVLYNISSKGVLLSDQYINASLDIYVKDCLFFELQRPGTTLTINQLSNNYDFLALFDAAANPAVYTTYYDNANPNGTPMTCNDAWNGFAGAGIKPAIQNAANYNDAIYSRCADAGFDPTSPGELVQCQSLITNMYTWAQGVSVSTIEGFRQTMIAQSVYNTVLKTSPDTMTQIIASRNAGTSMIATGMMANQWIPTIRAIMTAVAFCLIPLLALFIPTPAFGKAIGATVGFFLLLLIWGVIDAILHQFGMDYAQIAFEEVRRYKMGVTSIANFSTTTMKTLAAFGTIRWAGLMLATALTGMLVKFGGHAMAHVAGGVTAPAQGAGAKAGHQMLTPEGRSSTLNQLTAAPAAMANASKFSFTDQADARSSKSMSDVMSYQMNRDSAGGGGPASTAHESARAASYNWNESVGKSHQGSNADAYDKGSVGENQKLGQTKQAHVNAESMAGALGLSGSHAEKIQQLSQFKEGGEALTAGQAKNLSSVTGADFREGQKLEYNVGSDGAIHNLKGSGALKKGEHIDSKNSEGGKGYDLQAGGVLTTYGDGRMAYHGNYKDMGGPDTHNMHDGAIALQQRGDGSYHTVYAGGKAGFDNAFKQNTTTERDTTTTEKDGYRGSHGSQNTNYLNDDKDVGIRRGADGKSMSGTWNMESRVQPDGTLKRTDVSGNQSNVVSSSTAKTHMGADGTVSRGLSQETIDPRTGNAVQGSFDGTKDVKRIGEGGYLFKETTDMGGSGGYSSINRGSDTRDAHSMTRDQRVENHQNAESFLFDREQRFTGQWTGAQEAGVAVGGGVNAISGTINRLAPLGKLFSGGKAAAEGFKPKLPQVDPTSSHKTTDLPYSPVKYSPANPGNAADPGVVLGPK